MLDTSRAAGSKTRTFLPARVYRSRRLRHGATSTATKRHRSSCIFACIVRPALKALAHRASADSAQSADKAEAVRQIDAAVGDIKNAAIDDGKNLNDHSQLDDHTERCGRIHQALQILRKARADISREEDNGYANGLHDRAVGHRWSDRRGAS